MTPSSDHLGYGHCCHPTEHKNDSGQQRERIYGSQEATERPFGRVVANIILSVDKRSLADGILRLDRRADLVAHPRIGFSGERE